MVQWLLGRIASVCAAIGAAAMLMMMLHVVADISARYLLNRPFSGTIEIVSYYYMVALVFLAIPAAQFQREHITVDLFTALLPARGARWLDVVVTLAAGLFLSYFAWICYHEAIRRTRMGHSVEAGIQTMAVWPTRWLMVAGIGLTALIALYQAIALMRGSSRTQP